MRHCTGIWLLWAIIVGLLMSAPALAQMPTTPVGVDTVLQEPLSQTVPVIGRLVAPQSGEVSARTDGLVVEFLVRVGDRVEQGDPLAILDLDRLEALALLQEAELDEFEAQRATELAREKLARLQLERQAKLRGSAAFNQSQYDTQVQEVGVARGSRQEMEARIARGQVNVALFRAQVGYGTVKAPFAGTVTLRNVNQGAWVQRGDPVVTLINERNLEIEADVPANRLLGIAPNSIIAVRLEDGTQHQAQVRAIIPDENPASRTRPVRFTPQFHGTLPLAANQPVTLLLPVAAADNVVSVHKDAVLRKGGEAIVYVVQNGTANSRTVQLGEAVGNRFQVLEGLEPGDVVVIRGNERLRPGQKVSYPGQPD
ncbi:MAG: efflux RND transporter periplasmic adaptor subunit, partial [Candidatus Competibacteraceae bacterium]|nr:efflux RND transporter periplasmic adaptor subunit [Candidatus Competibacteraceae bacterium]